MILSSINKIRLEILIFILLGATAIASYIFFVSYNPKVVRPVEGINNVKGATTIHFELPLPKDAQSISYNQTLTSNNMIIKSVKSSEEIQQFYKNVMRDKGFEIESEQKKDNFFIREYKRDDRLITIVTTQQKENNQDGTETIAGIEIKSR